MRVDCAWCGLTMRVDMDPGTVEVVSHGICGGCRLTHFPQSLAVRRFFAALPPTQGTLCSSSTSDVCPVARSC